MKARVWWSLVALFAATGCAPSLAAVHQTTYPGSSSGYERIGVAPLGSPWLTVGAASHERALRATTRAQPLLLKAVLRAVVAHHYVPSLLDGGPSQESLAPLVAAILSGEGESLADAAPAVVVPGATVGSDDTDATLYVAGYAYFDRDRPYRVQRVREVFRGLGLAVATMGVGLSATSDPIVAADSAAWLDETAANSTPAPSGNRLMLAALLVDNRTGRLVWSAALPANVDVVDRYEVDRYVAALLAKLPRGR